MVIGGLLGATGVFVVLQISAGDSGSGSDATSLVRAVTDFALGRDRGGEAGSVTVAERLAIYRDFADTDATTLIRALEAAAAAPRSSATDIELEALLARLADLAPARAAALARELGLETRFVADAFVHWARVDSAAAIRGLATIESPSARRDVALALLDVVGDTGAGLDRVAAGLPDAERVPLRVAWISSRAEHDPYGAFREAQSLTEISQAGKALAQIAAAWAAQDPQGAIAQADLLSDQLESQFLTSLFREWARLDPAAYLDWLGSATSPPTQAIVGLELVAGTDPELVLGIANGMSGDAARFARQMAMRALAAADPEAAMARAAALPIGPDRDSILMGVGAAVARHDPDAALAWVQTVSPRSPNLMQIVMSSVAQFHPERALDLLENPPPGIDSRLLPLLVSSTMARDPEQARVLADRLLAGDSLQAASMLSDLVGNWMQQDPESALEWVLAHGSQINVTVLGSAAQSLARADPGTAASYVGQIPEEYRSAWITQVAALYGVHEPNAALAWVSQFQGQEVFDSALRSVITGMAQVDARAAAQAVSQASPDVQLGAAASVATRFANEDPRAAARWAEGLTDERARRGAIGSTVRVWAAADFAAAESYTLGLNRGEMRDEALGMLVLQSAQSGNFDRELLTAFDSDRALQQALARTIPLIARDDPEQAQQLLDRVTSAETRRQVEEQMRMLDASR